jgi:hypothetical protein
LLEDGDVFFLALPGILGGFSVAFELLVLGDGYFVVLELVIGDVVIFLFDVFSGFHQFSHFISIENLLLLLGSH